MDTIRVGYCDYHERDVLEREFGLKACWNCYHFDGSSDSEYVDVEEAAGQLQKSTSTIRRWLKDGRLKGKLFVRGRRYFNGGSPRKWLVKKESVGHHKV